MDEPPHRPIRVVFADDHPLTRDGIRDALKHAPDIEIVGEATDGLEAQRMVAELHPDVLLLDLVMPGLRPSEIERWVRTCCPETTVLVLTGHDRDCFLAQAVEARVSGFLTKREGAERIVEGIRRAARGEVLLTDGQLTRAIHWRKEVGERWERLTKREREVLRLMAQGLDNNGIAKTLCITLRRSSATSRASWTNWTCAHARKPSCGPTPTWRSCCDPQTAQRNP